MELLQVQLFRTHSNVNPIHRARIYLLSILWGVVIILWGGIHCMWGRVCHFVGVFVYAGAINRSPTAANRLPKHC